MSPQEQDEEQERLGAKTTPIPFPTKQLTILAICRFSEPIAFNSILAYTYVMVQDLHGGDDTDAPFYAGLLVSAYAVAEALTAVGWGVLSDRVGRKPVVLFGLVGVAISCLIFGLAQSYWVALLARFVGGALNGNVAVMQTMVAEMVKVPEHEPKAYATQPFVWTLGGIVGSALGGFLAQPAHFYPDIFPEDGLFGKYPYLLPNLVSVVVIVIAIIQGILFLEETNPIMERESAAIIDGEENRNSIAVFADGDEEGDGIDESTPLRRRQSGGSKRRRSTAGGGSRTRIPIERPAFLEESLPVAVEQSFDLRRSSFGTMHSIKLPIDDLRRQALQNQHAQNSTSSSSAPTAYRGSSLNFTIVMLTVALVLIAYHQMAFCTLLPTHLLDVPNYPSGHLDLRGGLGYTLHDVGIYLSVNGVLGLLIQGLIFPIFVEKAGVWKSFLWMIILYPTCYLIFPFLSAVPSSLQSPGIYLSLILQSFFGIIVTPCALILLKDAVPSPLVLGRVNGLAMSGCCLARTISPPLVGVIYSAGGSGAAWFSCAGVAVLGVMQLPWVPRRHIHDVVVDVDSGAILGKTISITNASEIDPERNGAISNGDGEGRRIAST